MRTRLLFGLMCLTAFAAGCADTDPAITTSIKSQLVADDLVKARRIDVDTRDSVVTLTGEVGSDAEKARAVEIARNSQGVSRVIDQLIIAPQPAPTTGVLPEADSATRDAAVTTAVKARLIANPDTSALRIDVDTDDGVVTLSGTVRSREEKDEAVRVAKETDGVTRVVDRLEIGSPRERN